MRQSITIGGISALGAGLPLHLIMVGVFGMILTSVVSGLTILDPLYSADRIESTWSILGDVLAIYATKY